jgi:dienelactone hydrolase
MQNPYTTSEGLVGRWITDRQSLLRREVETYLRDEILDYPTRSAAYWHRDYASVDAYQRSVAPNRERLRDTLGVFEGDGSALSPALDLWYENERFTAWWLTFDLLGGRTAAPGPAAPPPLRGRAILALPKGRTTPAPLVIAQHGVNSAPEDVFGVRDAAGMYFGYGRKLAEEGFAVVAPMNVSTSPARRRLERLCALLGYTLWGLEIHRTSRLLDYLETRPEVDVKRTAMYGLSLGGASTLFTTPLEPRIGAGVVSAFFNHRVNKLIVDDPRYECFLSIPEAEPWWMKGWLREFTDSDLVSLICPRPLLIEHGKADAIAWWPMVVEEYEASAAHYRKLGLADRIELDLHEGGHEIRLEKSLAFLKKWLRP